MVPRHKEGSVRWESMFYVTNFMHLALVWWTTALASNTSSEKRPLLNSYWGFQSFCPLRSGNVQVYQAQLYMG